jgi:hypothetical protein
MSWKEKFSRSSNKAVMIICELAHKTKNPSTPLGVTVRPSGVEAI